MQQAEFLASTDERFRPVYLSTAPDGTLYVVDMYHGIIQHRDYITEYLRDQILSRKLERPARTRAHLSHRARHDAARAEAGAVAAVAGQLVAAPLASEWLVARHGAAAARRARRRVGRAHAEEAARRARQDDAALHALWTLDGLDSLDAGHGQSERSPIRRATCARQPCACRSDGCAEPGHPLQAAVLQARR